MQGDSPCWQYSGMLAMALILGVPGSARADDRVVAGRELALNVCAACHVVAPSQEVPPLLTPPAPPFAEIARRPATSAAGLRTFLQHTHWDEKTVPVTMPNPSLTDVQIRAVTAYLLSLRGE